MTLNILVAPSGFKESLSAHEVANAITTGVKLALPDAEVFAVPMVDGGEGFTQALVEFTGGTSHGLTATGPVGNPVQSHFGFLGGTRNKHAVLEMAAAAGLRLVPRHARDPRNTTSHGVGELIRATLDAGAERILVGCGDSGINDGGAGMAQALGVRLLDDRGEEIGFGGGELARLRHIDLSGRDPRLDRVRIDAAVNWHNVLLGPRGVARVFGPQKGATPEIVEELDEALENYADVIRRDVGVDVGAMPGSGASGGLGAGLAALLGGRLHPRYEIVMRYIDLDHLLKRADIVFTAEGCLDAQTPWGKVPAEVARRAKRYGLPVVALAGTVGEGASTNLEHGIDAYFSIVDCPCSLQESIDKAHQLVANAAEQVARTLRLWSNQLVPEQRLTA
ncbi:MAG: glycerate kinase [Proteobacteria bacterium]|nr:glycerate kinase [Pseudomonadota bacterium]